MNKFIEQFKDRARKKELTGADMISHCLYKTVKAKSENKLEILKYFLSKSFTPRKSGDYQGFWNARYLRAFLYKKEYMLPGLKIEDVFTEEEQQIYIELVNSRWRIGND